MNKTQGKVIYNFYLLLDTRVISSTTFYAN